LQLEISITIINNSHSQSYTINFSNTLHLPNISPDFQSLSTTSVKMVAFGKSAAVSTMGLVAMVQFCPAPFLAAIPAATAAGINTAAAVIGAAGGVAGAVTGAISAANGRRGMFPRQEQNELAWQLCREQLTGATITFDGPSPGSKFNPFDTF
jgi:hypothetical protein